MCNASGIGFELAHRSNNYLWDIGIGPDQLTLELAAKRGYTISNSSNSLLIFVPLFAKGYEYKVRTGIGGGGGVQWFPVNVHISPFFFF